VPSKNGKPLLYTFLKSNSMKKYFLFLSAFSLLISFTACKKESGTPVNNDTEIAAHSDDQSQFSTELDAIANEGNLAIESSSIFSGRFQSLQSVICDANVVFDINSNPKTITITYDGSNCLGNRTRTGSVVISMGQGVQWKNAGAAVNISFQNLKITRTSDNKSVIINGTQTYTNVSGGLLINLPTLNSITHSITSNGLSLTFNNGSQRIWQIAKQRVFTYNNGVIITATGTHTEGNTTNIAEWGTNRFGNAFTTIVTSPLIVRQDCNFRLTSGAVKHSTNAFTATATFGLDINGNATSCPGTGNYYYKLVWVGPNGNSRSVILSY
jgi:hypothetical protein